MSKNREQQLIDICFQIGLVIQSDRQTFGGRSLKYVSEWIRKQLIENGFDIVPIGMSHGVLRNGNRK